jgi:uncharacterized sulfatase
MQELRRVHAEGKLRPEAEQFMADSKPREELYDLHSDPHEVKNLAANPEMAPVLARLRAAHENWARETRDLGLIPEPELVEREKKLGSRYAILRQPGANDLIRRLRESPSLSDPDPAVRYWAARAAKPSDARKLLHDASPVVRIAAAQRCADLSVLEAEMKNAEEWVRLHAALALDSLGEKARPSIPAMKAAMESGHRYLVRVVNHTLNRLLGTNHKVA